ncbi:MAG TPA: flagellar basal body rod protein FlgB [Pseudolabrys sp.]|nr:flagellar basal body rod protein FlgB [Pseudolabrys sp.]
MGFGLSDLPVLSMLRTRMEWSQARQRVLAENVANADTPGFQARDLVPPKFDEPNQLAAPQVSDVSLDRTEPLHLPGLEGPGSEFKSTRDGNFDVKPTGNAVNLEDQMMKVAGNQMDYQVATALYMRSLGLIKTALGK